MPGATGRDASVQSGGGRYDPSDDRAGPRRLVAQPRVADPLRERGRGLLLLGSGAYQVAILSLLVLTVLMVRGFLIVRGVPEGSPRADLEALVHPLEPAVVPPGKVSA